MTIQDAQRMLGYPEELVGLRVGYGSTRFHYAILDSGFAGLLEWLERHPEEAALTSFAYDVADDVNDHGYWVYRIVRAIAPDAHIYIGRGLDPSHLVWLHEQGVRFGSMSVGYTGWFDPAGSNLNDQARHYLDLLERTGIFLFTAIGNDHQRVFLDHVRDQSGDGWLEAASGGDGAALHTFEVHPALPLQIQVASNHWEVPIELFVEVVALDTLEPIAGLSATRNSFGQIVIQGQHDHAGMAALRIAASGAPPGSEGALRIRILHQAGTRGYVSNGLESAAFPGVMESPYIISVGSFGRDPATLQPIPSSFSAVAERDERFPLVHGPGELIIDNRVIRGTSFSTPFIGALAALRPVVSPRSMMAWVSRHDAWLAETEAARLSRWGIPSYALLIDRELDVGELTISRVSAEWLESGDLRLQFVAQRPHMAGVTLHFTMELLDPNSGAPVPSAQTGEPLLIRGRASPSEGGDAINRWVYLDIEAEQLPAAWRGAEARVRTSVATSIWLERQSEVPELSGTVRLPQ